MIPLSLEGPTQHCRRKLHSQTLPLEWQWCPVQSETPLGNHLQITPLLFYPKQMKYFLQYEWASHRQKSTALSMGNMMNNTMAFASQMSRVVRLWSNGKCLHPHALSSQRLSQHRIVMFLKPHEVWEKIGTIFAPRLTWHSRKRLLTNPCHLTLPTRSPKGSLSSHLSFGGDFGLGGRNHMGHSPSLVLSAQQHSGEALDPSAFLTSRPGSLLLDKQSWAIPGNTFIHSDVTGSHPFVHVCTHKHKSCPSCLPYIHLVVCPTGTQLARV